MTDDKHGRTARRARSRRSAEPSQPDRQAPDRLSKLDQLLVLLARPDGASLAELAAATGWQQHSVRGALAGALKKKGHAVLSDKVDGTRRYRVEVAQ